MSGEIPANAVAVIGMACRVPGANNVGEFWRNLCDGIESVQFFTDAEIEDNFPPETRARPEYVKARPIISDVAGFDAAFFGMYPREAALTDPQQRLFLECAWEALESAGYDPAAYPGAIGVFAGASMNTYFLHHVCADRSVIEDFTSSFQIGNYPMLVGAGDFVATRAAYKLDLRGPVMAVQTACSTSLVAIAQACQSLLMYQADMMLAGGASISFPRHRGYLHQEGGMVAADGHCRTFDEKASGTVFGEGVAVVLLKRLEDALADGDHINAVILGSAVNNDGAGKVGFTAPSVAGQVAVVAGAQAMAGVEPGQISYIECHGTGTPLGDPIEVAALTQVFRAATAEVGFCTLGSAKTNIGHLDAAAGAAGLIKTALALEHRQLPPTLHFQHPNPRLELAGGPFVVSSSLQPWPEGAAPRRAGVTALGVGGTNAHVVMQEAPSQPATDPARPVELLLLSARTDTALQNMRERLAAHLRAHPDQNLGDVAFTLQRGRRGFPCRLALACADRDQAIEKLAGDKLTGGAGPILGHAPAAPPAVAFLFPGQGSQHANMARNLYQHEPVFRAAIDECAELLHGPMGLDLRDLLYRTEDLADDANPLTATTVAQPAIFTIEYALAQLWMSWGVRPSAMVGHSVGEFVAACIGGTIALADALALVAARGALMQAVPPGAMLSVRMSEAALLPLLGPTLSIAAVNSPNLCVTAGPFEAIAALEADLAAQGAAARRLHTSHAFHSAMMEPVLPALAVRLAQISLHPPQIPWVSGVTGRWITAEQATSPDYWAHHCREPVRFADALATLVEADAPVLLEVGPGRALSTLAVQGAGRKLVVATSLPDATQPGADLGAIHEALGRLWTAGVAPDWPAVRGQDRRGRVPLPTYPFERERCWIDAPSATQRSPAPAAVAPQEEPTMSQTTLPAAPQTNDHPARVRARIIEILERLSGEDLADANPRQSFLELGFDSLFLGQFAGELGSRLGVTVAFRELLGDLSSVAALTDYAANLILPEPVAAPSMAQAAAFSAPTISTAPSATPGSVIEVVMRDQLQAMQTLINQQLAALSGMGQSTSVQAGPVPSASVLAAPVQKAPPQTAPTDAGGAEPPSRFSVYRPGSQSTGAGFSPTQQQHLDALITRYTTLTPGSKQAAQQYRQRLADPRAASGFRAEWKEMVYPIVCVRSKGARIWDVDGNEYIDLVNGYGPTFFGHAPDFVVEAIEAQLHQGFAIGPQTLLAGEVADLLCELTGNERATFCNTGSEAVMAALRVARAVTGRDRVVMFGGAYHGQFDEVLVKGARSGEPRALPVAPGIPAGSVQNMVVLPYATPESLAWVRAHAGELAAVVVETVQSRHPTLQPHEFLGALREITTASGSALVFDEVVTGFRMHPGGMQALFDIRADLATYGKVVGGGMPVGVLAGKARFMDALDGGQWSFGDDSYPMVAPTFFAGTFVRHPLTMAAVKAVLLRLKESGPALQEELTRRTAGLVARLNAALAEVGLKPLIESFGSLFYFTLSGEQKLGSLLWYHLRARGIYMQEGFPCFVTTEHGIEEIDRIVAAFTDSLRELIADGVLEPTEPRPITEIIEVAPTEPQTEVWLAAQLGDEASRAFNEGISLRLDGPLDANILGAALNDVVARHDALRTVFAPTGEMLRILPQLTLDLPVSDLGRHGEAELAALALAEARTAFDLAAGPLVRARLARLGRDQHVLIFTAHHLICDGWSMNVIIGELANRYTARSQGSAPVLGLVLPFSSYAAQKAAHPDEQAKAYWLAQFKNPPPPFDLPTDRPRPPRKSFRGATFTDHIDATLAAAIKKSGARQGCTLFVTLLGAFQATLGRLAGASDLVVGIPAAGQSARPDQVLVGHCVHFLPIRAQWGEATPMAALLRDLRQTVLEAYDHQECTLGTIVRGLDLPREPGRVPLVEVQFNLEKLGERIEMPGLAVAMTPNPKLFVNFDLFLNVIESSQGLRLDIDYSTDLFDETTIARWVGHFRAILAAITADAEREIRRLPLLSDTERKTMLTVLSGSAGPLPDVSTDALILTQATRSPDRIAVRCGNARLTYRELIDRADRLAARLRRELPDPDGRVGVLMARSIDLPVALLAVMRAGLAYVPLDPAHPAARTRAILEEADVRLLLVDADPLAERAPAGVAVVKLAEAWATVDEPPPESAPQDPRGGTRTAYVIFTSGSTGKPKGVEISHRALVNLLLAMAQTPGFSADDRLLAVTTVGFDIAALELFLPLITGGEVVIAGPDEAADGFALVRLLRDHRITIMQATPSLWRIMLEAEFRAAPGFRVLCGGEPLDGALAERLLEGGGELWNMYGPTETTVWSSCERIMPGAGAITVGRPIQNTQFFILNAARELCPPGVAGSLFIGGEGLARGYFHQSELTAQSFPSVAIDGVTQRIYSTGDLARLTPHGRTQLLGRCDSQVKLRGFRIELGEIENALAQVGSVAAAAVALRTEIGGGQLVGYYVERPGAGCSPNALMRALSAGLPEYMVPALWMRLDAVPMTANGKIDRKLLPAPDLQAFASARVAEPPRTPLEAKLAKIWQEVLGVEQIGIHDNLFNLGADSIHMFRIAARMMHEGIALSARHLLLHPTIAELAPAAADEPVPQTVSLADFIRERRARSAP